MTRFTIVALATLLVCGLDTALATTPKPHAPELDRFEKQVIVSAAVDPMQMDVLADGRVFFIERQGTVKLFLPDTGEVVTVGRVPVGVFVEVGLIGMALAADFDASGNIYLFYCPEEKQETLRLSSFQIRDNRLDMSTQRTILEYPIDKKEAVHMGGGLYACKSGDLYIGTGDNTVPIPELPIDQRPGHEYRDAMRTSANTRDLRGKILRIHPNADGSYSIPAGNLFPDGSDGRPEIYAMGCRNPFRLFVDEQTDTLYWGDVGPNISMSVDIGPEGYDEFNRTSQAGNFGWPMFIGPNFPYRNYDFESGELGAEFNARSPRNTSRNNTGSFGLPAAQPAFLWYPSTTSSEFPELGSGGRSAMAGPVYYDRAEFDPTVKLPCSFHEKLFIHDWTRNWIKTVEFDEEGRVSNIEPFMPNTQFRKPMQLELRADGSLYVLEFGDKWFDNRDAQISRIVYRRGNRNPVPKLVIKPTAGKQPLKVRIDGSDSFDKDAGDRIEFAWSLEGVDIDNAGAANFTHVFTKPGEYEVELKVTDQHGMKSFVRETINVGNATPEVSLLEPRRGSFFDWGQIVKFRVRVEDEEDGTTLDHSIFHDRVSVKATYHSRRYTEEHDQNLPRGLKLMRKTTCFSCHTTGSPSGGPAYLQVAKKYSSDKGAKVKLAKKILAGGAGSWGNKVMPPHPQHSLAEANEMVEWILSLDSDRSVQMLGGTHGAFQAPIEPADPRAHGGVLLVEAKYTDDGYGKAPPQTKAEAVVLHARRKNVAYFDEFDKVETVEVFEGQEGLATYFKDNGFALLRDVDLSEIDHISCRAAVPSGTGGTVELRVNHVEGPLLGSFAVSAREDNRLKFEQFDVNLDSPVGLTNLAVVARNGRNSNDAMLAVSWMEFHHSRVAEPQHAKVVVIPVAGKEIEVSQHARRCCQIIASCLNRQNLMMAVVSPEDDWPADHRVIADAAAVAFCEPARISSKRQQQTPSSLLLSERKQLLRSLGVGVVELRIPSIDENVDARKLVTAEKSNKQHEVLLGVDSFPFKGNLDDHPESASFGSVVALTSDSYRQVPLAWLEEPNDRGRKFCIHVGDFTSNFAQESLRKLIIQATLWASRRSLSPQAIDTWIDPSQIARPRAFVHNWTLDELVPVLVEQGRHGSFARGKQLFTAASCSSCHRIRNSGGQLGPDLTQAVQRIPQGVEPRVKLLKEILHPAEVIHPDFKTRVALLSSGQTRVGIVVGDDEDAIRMVTDPTQIDKVETIPLDQVEELLDSSVSMMPSGLLNTLERDEILDLLTYVEAGGDPSHANYNSSTQAGGLR